MSRVPRRDNLGLPLGERKRAPRVLDGQGFLIVVVLLCQHVKIRVLLIEANPSSGLLCGIVNPILQPLSSLDEATVLQRSPLCRGLGGRALRR